MRREIDSSIIWKKINGELNEQEHKELDAWIKESHKNKIYYKKSISFFKNGGLFKLTDIDINRAFNRVSFKIFMLPKLRVASSVAVMLLLLIGSIYFYSDINYSDSEKVAISIIEPGYSKATLTLSDGSKYNLENTKTVELKELGTRITNSKRELNYQKLNTKNKQKEADLAERYNTVSIPRGGEYHLSLSDGTKVWLNSESTLTYPVAFGDNERRVELTGEALFEVAHNPNNPFRIKLNGQQIEVLGTSFNVNSYPDKANIATTLIDGSVKIEVDGSDNEIMLKPGDQCLFNRLDRSSTVNPVNVRKYIAWKDGNYIFEDETLEDMMYTLARWYDFSYTFKDNSVRNLTFNGKLSKSYQFEDILTIIENTNEVQFRVEEDQVFIEKEREDKS